MEQPTIYESFGLRLSALRQERGLSQRELAESLAVTRQAVSNWETQTSGRAFSFSRSPNPQLLFLR